MPLNLEHQTLTQFMTRFRERYRDALREECARLAWWLIERLNAGDITDAQIRSAFSLTAQQYNQLKVRLMAIHAHWVAVLAARGE